MMRAEVNWKYCGTEVIEALEKAGVRSRVDNKL